MITKRPPKKHLCSRARHYVTFQEESRASDGEGGFVVTWANISGSVNIPAEVLPITAARREEMRSRNVHATHYIRVRTNHTIDETGRVSWGSRTFKIHSVENIQERDIEQFVIAEEIRP